MEKDELLKSFKLATIKRFPVMGPVSGMSRRRRKSAEILVTGSNLRISSWVNTRIGPLKSHCQFANKVEGKFDRGGGYSWEFLVGVCSPVLQILTLYQTKKCHFPHPFSDQTLNPYIASYSTQASLIFFQSPTFNCIKWFTPKSNLHNGINRANNSLWKTYLWSNQPLDSSWGH